MENLDNQHHKNNIRLKKLKEQVEGANLQSYLADLFESILREDDAKKIKIDSAFRVGPIKKQLGRPRDVVVKFVDWTSKQLIMYNCRQHRKLIIEDQEVQIFSNFPPITLQKLHDFRFLTNCLRKYNINYSWGFTFKLVVDYKAKKKISIRSVEDAKIFSDLLERDVDGSGLVIDRVLSYSFFVYFCLFFSFFSLFNKW